MLKDTFTFQGPLGEIECVVEPNRSENNAVLVMAHGFRGCRDSGGRAAGVAQQAAAHAAVVRFNFTGTQIISRQGRSCAPYWRRYAAGSLAVGCFFWDAAWAVQLPS